MKLTFIGVGAAFSLKNNHSNMLLDEGGRRMLIDCGGTAQKALADLGLDSTNIDDVYISHQHADHAGGLEWLCFTRYFARSAKPLPRLFVNSGLKDVLWDHTLSGGLGLHTAGLQKLESYFSEIRAVPEGGTFDWQHASFQTIKFPHITDGIHNLFSYGLIITTPRGKTLITTDTAILAPADLCQSANLVFHDCEAAPYQSGVHAHYTQLRTLPAEIKAKMWLYHYPDYDLPDAVADGFAGFVRKGQSFEI